MRTRWRAACHCVRELLGGATALAAGALVAGCSLPFAQQTVTPFKLTRPATVAFDVTVPAALQAPLVALLKKSPGSPAPPPLARSRALIW